jgi:catechol-2,3-dioxygenase
MLTRLSALALEVWFLPRARPFYEETLNLPVRADRSGEGEVVYDVGGADLLLREPGPVPRGGVHVHYALAAPPPAYADWTERLSERPDYETVDFGATESLFVYDRDDHCVEIGDRGEGDGRLDGVFEIALEVESLETAESFYRALGFEVVDRGEGRRRTRLAGAVDLELWEPQRGLADARGGVHADLRFAAPDPGAVIDAVADRALDATELPAERGVRLRDPDGHYLTAVPPGA